MAVAGPPRSPMLAEGRVRERPTINRDVDSPPSWLVQCHGAGNGPVGGVEDEQVRLWEGQNGVDQILEVP